MSPLGGSHVCVGSLCLERTYSPILVFIIMVKRVKEIAGISGDFLCSQTGFSRLLVESSGVEMSVRTGYRPVSNPARDGLHKDAVALKLVRVVPSSAMRLRLGWLIAVDSRSPTPRSSHRMMIILRDVS